MNKRILAYNKLDFSDLQSQIDLLCSDLSCENKYSQDHKVVCFGSCFAKNVHDALVASGKASKFFAIAEYINTPFANLLYLAKLLGEPIGAFDLPDNTKDLISNKQSLVELQNAKVAIITIGVGFVWVHSESNKIVIKPNVRQINDYKTKYLPIGHQSKLIIKIAEKLKKINPEVDVWITLSPVPVEFSLNYKSAVISDCVSKSILRAAIHEAMMQSALFNYFPSFEFFRWVSGHSEKSFFGQDGKVRHVNENMVKLLIDKFISLNWYDAQR